MAVIVPILSKWDGGGVKQAKRAFSGLSRDVGGLKRMLAGGLAFVGLNASVRGLYDAAKAANADIKSQELLNRVLKATSRANKEAMAGAESFIQTLASQTGIIDDELRPALGQLSAVTHNTRKAQKLLSTALDLSTVKAKPLATVQKAITRAYAGNLQSLTKLAPEIIKVTDKYEKQNGKAKTLAEKTKMARYALDYLGKTYKGITAQQATPFDKMNVALDNLKEAVGAAVLPELTKLVNYITIHVVPKVQEFMGELTNPKTEVGQAFSRLKTDIKELITGFKDFFAIFSKDGKSGAVGFINFVDQIVKGAPAIIGVMAAFKAIRFLTMPIGKGSILSGLIWLAKFGKSGPLAFLGLGALGLTEGAKATQKSLKNQGIDTYGAAKDFGAYGGRLPMDYLQKNYGAMGGNVTINISGVVGDKVAVGKAVTEALKAYNQKNGTNYTRPNVWAR